jgi:hypothetical protein
LAIGDDFTLTRYEKTQLYQRNITTISNITIVSNDAENYKPVALFYFHAEVCSLTLSLTFDLQTLTKRSMDFDEAANAYRKRSFLEADDRHENGSRAGDGGGDNEFWSSDEEEGVPADRMDSMRRAHRVRSPVQQPRSMWFRWVSERRAAHENRLLSLEEQQRQVEQNRVPTPVKKARLESQVDLDLVDGCSGLLLQSCC